MDLFDFTDVSDLPEEIKPPKRANSAATERILELMKIANRPVRSWELCIAYYRKYNRIITKNKMMARVNYLLKSKNKTIMKVESGLYTLINKGDNNATDNKE